MCVITIQMVLKVSHRPWENTWQASRDREIRALSWEALHIKNLVRWGRTRKEDWKGLTREGGISGGWCCPGIRERKCYKEEKLISCQLCQLEQKWIFGFRDVGVVSELDKSSVYRTGEAKVWSEWVQKNMGGKKSETLCMANSLEERVGKRQYLEGEEKWQPFWMLMRIIQYRGKFGAAGETRKNAGTMSLSRWDGVGGAQGEVLPLSGNMNGSPRDRREGSVPAS